MRWLVMPFRRYADFKGRSGRTEFWTFFGLSVAAFLVTVVATGLSADMSTVTQPKVPGANTLPAGVIGYMLWWLASIVPWFAAQVRRFHDQGRSGWLCLIGVGGYVAVGFGAMPVAGILFLAAMALMAIPGEETENRFGMQVESEGEEGPDNSAFQFSESTESASATLVEPDSMLQHETGTLTGDDGLYDGKSQIVASPVEAERIDDRSRIDDSTSSSESAFSGQDSLAEVATKYKSTVVENGRGQFICGGHIFSIRDEAEWFDQRRALALASIANSLGASQPQPNGTTNTWNEIEAGINFGRDGHFYVRGNSYWTIEECQLEMLNSAKWLIR
jgi:uncharacterized membrane protein YhaH (DUF805 family)